MVWEGGREIGVGGSVKSNVYSLYRVCCVSIGGLETLL